MDAARHPLAQTIIHKAMSGDPAQAGEGRADEADMEVPALARAGMAGMQVAVVAHGQFDHGQAFAQAGVELGGIGCGGFAHDCSGVSACFMCLPR